MRTVSMKFVSVHCPRPVSLSGVRLAVKLVPQGPDHAVMVALSVAIHGPGGSFKARLNDAHEVVPGGGVPCTTATGKSEVLDVEAEVKDAPEDLAQDGFGEAPVELARQLRELGAW